MRHAAEVTCPTLLVVAEHDEIAPPGVMHDVARAIGAGAEVASYDCAHFALYRGVDDSLSGRPPSWPGCCDRANVVRVRTHPLWNPFEQPTEAEIAAARVARQHRTGARRGRGARPGLAVVVRRRTPQLGARSATGR